MTERLYYRIPALYECDARVLSCERSGEIYHVVLDRTIIFPEGGGQISDSGSIGDAVCFEAHEAGEAVIHFCDRPLDIGAAVNVSLDIGARLDHTEQHTGEHMLSGAAHRLFGAVNVGFHMARDYCTIDFDTPLSDEQLDALELEANAAVRRDLPIHTDVVDAEEASSRRLRKHASGLSGMVRIVYIDNGNVDSCTCCGTHFERTGHVGAIKITDHQKYKGGTRLWFACGGRAVEAARRMQAGMTALARRFSTSREELYSAVVKQGDELVAIRQEMKRKTYMLCEYMAERFIARTEPIRGIRPIVVRIDGFNMNDLKMLTERIASDAKCVVLAFGTGNDGSCCYRMVRSEGVDLSMRELCNAVNATVNGKGGGSPVFAQGSAASVSDDVVDMLEGYLRRVLAG